MTRPTTTARVLNSKFAVQVTSRLPIPLAWARPFLVRDNRQENTADGWSRLRAPTEAARYRAVRSLVEKYASDGFVLDVGCSQGVLQEGLTYARYVGIDSYDQPIRQAAVRADEDTHFYRVDADSFVPDQPPDAVILNEVLYYLPRPLATVDRYAQLVAPDGVLIVSLLHAWATRRLLRQLSDRFPVVDQVVVGNGSHLAWTVSVLRPAEVPSGARMAGPTSGIA